MLKKYRKLFFVLMFLVLAAGQLSVFQTAGAAENINETIGDQMDDLEQIGLPGEADNPLDWVVFLVRAVLGFMGLVFLVLIIYAGVKWMTSGGNSTTIEDAKKIITNAVIGLAIVAFSFAITQFVFNVILKTG
ncbi:hypothetical protein A3H55_03225 [Candidatus Kuenenbacteria bacterium RIFCSPLOWO2_02_FULL_42_16]|uniref:DUF5671 domain-containing protein n=1 Tax=Candidatus Kuenenbacteria bacterium RIFCSPLOWO2_02_FULL_42_16 TaxID=1798564 RepID=A0A1F6FXX9_9BACT|nr:MAG: hypothetical protein A3H55_03225 [Candidatus Kuenenbacteria bacterium RIFCSPLOWO2_02_FULL_42_16]